jgi:hypothetical protein
VQIQKKKLESAQPFDPPASGIPFENGDFFFCPLFIKEGWGGSTEI